MVAGWSKGDALAVAVFSGLAEEAFIRALLQPLIGLVPAAAVFAVKRRLGIVLAMPNRLTRSALSG